MRCNSFEYHRAPPSHPTRLQKQTHTEGGRHTEQRQTTTAASERCACSPTDSERYGASIRTEECRRRRRRRRPNNVCWLRVGGWWAIGRENYDPKTKHALSHPHTHTLTKRKTCSLPNDTRWGRGCDKKMYICVSVCVCVRMCQCANVMRDSGMLIFLSASPQPVSFRSYRTLNTFAGCGCACDTSEYLCCANSCVFLCVGVCVCWNLCVFSEWVYLCEFHMIIYIVFSASGKRKRIITGSTIQYRITSWSVRVQYQQQKTARPHFPYTGWHVSERTAFNRCAAHNKYITSCQQPHTHARTQACDGLYSGTLYRLLQLHANTHTFQPTAFNTD